MIDPLLEAGFVPRAAAGAQAHSAFQSEDPRDYEKPLRQPASFVSGREGAPGPG
jgi:hypothetical protein